MHFLLITIIMFELVKSAQNLRSIKRVGIIGAGPGGLSLAASLKLLHADVETITLFESRATYLQAAQGGGVQLSGGSIVIEKLGYLPQLNDIAQPLNRILSRSADGAKLLDIDISNLLETKAPQLMSPKGPKYYSIMRDALQQLLYDMTCTTQDPATVTIQTSQGVESISESPDSVTVHLTTGQSHTFDLLVGADGIRSTAKKHIASIINPSSKSSPSDSDVRDTGIRIVYAITPPDSGFELRPGGKGAFFQWFGDGAYVLSASYGGLKGGVQHMMAFVYRESGEENAGWEGKGTGGNTGNDRLRSLLIKAGFGEETGLFALLDGCDASRTIELGVRDRSLPLFNWSSPSGRVVLLGDAAHPMAPFLGQGANQALQDSFVLAGMIKKVNEGTCTLPDAMRRYQWTRLWPTAFISIKSNFLGALETLGGPVGRAVRDNFFRVTGMIGIAQMVLLSGAIPVLE